MTREDHYLSAGSGADPHLAVPQLRADGQAGGNRVMAEPQPFPTYIRLNLLPLAPPTLAGALRGTWRRLSAPLFLLMRFSCLSERQRGVARLLADSSLSPFQKRPGVSSAWHARVDTAKCGLLFFCPSERTPLLMLLLIHVIVLFFFLMILTCFHLPPKTPNDINIKGIFRSIYKFHPFAGTDLGAISNSHSGLSQGEEFHLLKACDGEGPSNGRHASVLLVRGQQSNSNCPCENQPQSPLQPPGLDRANKPSNQNPAFMTSKVSGSNWFDIFRT